MPEAGGSERGAGSDAAEALAADGPLAYCGPEELMRLLVAELEEEDAGPA